MAGGPWAASPSPGRRPFGNHVQHRSREHGMSRTVRTATGIAVVAVALVLFLAAIALSGFNHDTGNVLSGGGIVAFAAVGAVIVIKRPDNRVGPLLCAAGLAGAVLGAATEYASRALI